MILGPSRPSDPDDRPPGPNCDPKKGITDARSDLKILYKQLRDELNTDYAALMAAGLAELDQSQNELRTSALWYVKAGDSLAPEFKDETERLIGMVLS